MMIDDTVYGNVVVMNMNIILFLIIVVMNMNIILFLIIVIEGLSLLQSNL